MLTDLKSHKWLTFGDFLVDNFPRINLADYMDESGHPTKGAIEIIICELEELLENNAEVYIGYYRPNLLWSPEFYWDKKSWLGYGLSEGVSQGNNRYAQEDVIKFHFSEIRSVYGYLVDFNK